MVRHPQASYIVTPCCLWKWPHRKSNQFIGRCHAYARKSALQAVLSRMHLTLDATRRTLHGASRLVLAMSAWSVKPRRAPSQHFRDARVYGHITTAIHDMNTPPCPPAGLASVGSDTVKHAAHYVSFTIRYILFLFFLAVAASDGRVGSVFGTRKAPMWKLHSNPIAVSASGHKSVNSTLSCICRKVCLTSGF